MTTMPRPRAEATVRRMLTAVQHEPFYRTSVSIDDELGIYVGCCEREGSFAGERPQRNAAGDALFFSGEDFADPALVRRLRARAGVPDDAPEGAYLMALADEDPAFPASLNGRFHGLLVNRRRREALLFNDRYGLHRLYYHQRHDGFYFAAEAKAILAVCPELASIDPRCLAEYVACGCVMENRTLFEGLSVLPPGSAWICRGGAVERTGRYFSPKEWEQQSPLSAEAYYDALRGALSTTLPRYFSGREQVGVSLTGGFDTRIIMAWHKARPGTLPCYTFGGARRTSHDVLVAREVARAVGQPHHTIRVDGDFLGRFADYAERTVFLSDGCADVSRTADLYVNEIARTLAPVRMTGNYGSEVLRQVRAFKPITPAAGLFDRSLLVHVPAARETYASLLGGHPLSFAVFRQAPWHHYGLLKLEESQLSVRTPYLDNDLVRAVFRAPAGAAAGPDVSTRLIADGNSELLAIPTDRAVDPRANVPSLARALREFSFKAEYGYDYGMPQWVTRIDHALSPLRLERLFLGRHKFYHFRIWYRDALSPYVRERLLDATALARPYVQRRAMEAMITDHVRGVRNYTLEIHRLLTLELIHRQFIDRHALAPRPDADVPAYAV